MDNTLQTSNGLYLVSFRGNRYNTVFKRENEVLGNLIQAHGQHGIESLCELDEAKLKFKKMSKERIKLLFGWDTHSMEQMKHKNFIK